MDLSSYVDTLRHELAVAARSAGPDAETLAERLTAPLESATRLVLQEAVSDAAQEISRDLAPGSVDVRLRGRELGFVVDRGPREGAAGATTDRAGWPPTPTAPLSPGDGPQDAAAAKEGDAGTARITVRLPESLKAQIEAAAEREGVSVNAYLVRTLGAALQPGTSSSSASWSHSGNQLSGRVQ
jgi:HicB family